MYCVCTVAKGCLIVITNFSIAFLDFETAADANEFVKEGVCTIEGQSYNVEMAKAKGAKTANPPGKESSSSASFLFQGLPHKDK